MPPNGLAFDVPCYKPNYSNNERGGVLRCPSPPSSPLFEVKEHARWALSAVLDQEVVNFFVVLCTIISFYLGGQLCLHRLGDWFGPLKFMQHFITESCDLGSNEIVDCLDFLRDKPFGGWSTSRQLMLLCHTIKLHLTEFLDFTDNRRNNLSVSDCANASGTWHIHWLPMCLWFAARNPSGACDHNSLYHRNFYTGTRAFIHPRASIISLWEPLVIFAEWVQFWRASNETGREETALQLSVLPPLPRRDTTPTNIPPTTASTG